MKKQVMLLSAVFLWMQGTPVAAQGYEGLIPDDGSSPAAARAAPAPAASADLYDFAGVQENVYAPGVVPGAAAPPTADIYSFVDDAQYSGPQAATNRALDARQKAVDQKAAMKEANAKAKAEMRALEKKEKMAIIRQQQAERLEMLKRAEAAKNAGYAR